MTQDWLARGDRAALARAAIHRAAREVLAERGVQGFTAERVADRAGCSRATLYRVAGGKQAILDAVLSEAATAVLARISSELANAEGEERLIGAILIALRQIRADPPLQAWLRRAALHDRTLGRDSMFAEFAGEISGVSGPAAGDWIHRVFLMLVIWPAEDETAERQLLIDFVAPAFERRDRATPQAGE